MDLVLYLEKLEGKSIILEAISLLMGKRSDRESLFDKNIKCVLELSLIIKIIKKIFLLKIILILIQIL